LICQEINKNKHKIKMMTSKTIVVATAITTQMCLAIDLASEKYEHNAS